MDKKLISPIKPMFDKKTLVKLILPIMAEQILAALIGMADTLMVSNCCLLYTSECGNVVLNEFISCTKMFGNFRKKINGC